MLGDDSIVLLVVLVCMVVMSAYFSATETAFTSLNRIRLKSRADNGDARAARVLALAEKYDLLLSTILIGNNIVNNVATTLSAVLFIDLLGKTTGPAVSTVVLTIVILIFGEVSPKSLAKEAPERFALFSAPILRVFMVILTPATFFFTLWKKLLSKIFRTKEVQVIRVRFTCDGDESEAVKRIFGVSRFVKINMTRSDAGRECVAYIRYTGNFDIQHIKAAFDECPFIKSIERSLDE